jgi:hypothetical protein
MALNEWSDPKWLSEKLGKELVRVTEESMAGAGGYAARMKRIIGWCSDGTVAVRLVCKWLPQETHEQSRRLG